jgi:peptidoglycan hydrolase CwlO-like protein
MTQLLDALENDKSELWELVKENQARLNTLSAEIAKLKAAQD